LLAKVLQRLGVSCAPLLFNLRISLALLLSHWGSRIPEAHQLCAHSAVDILKFHAVLATTSLLDND
jgi:hypothetical protein